MAIGMAPRFADMPPTQIVTTLADEGVYGASESTMYRVLHENDTQHHRRRVVKRRPVLHESGTCEGCCRTLGSKADRQLDFETPTSMLLICLNYGVT